MITGYDIANAWMQDERAFEQLFRSCYQSLCNSANTILNDPDEAEETVQQVFISLWEKRMQMEINNSIQSYLYKAVRNSALNRIKHQKVRKQYHEEQKLRYNNTEPHVQASHLQELETQIRNAIEKLPEQCRIIFKLSRFEELSYSEIAGQLGISKKTVENQIGKALKIIREEMKEYLALFLVLICLQLIH